MKEQNAAEFDRLSSMAMAAGKDFNDQLTFILNHAGVSLGLLGPDHPASRDIVELTHAAMRCAQTTRSLLLSAGRARAPVRPAPDPAEDPAIDPADNDEAG